MSYKLSLCSFSEQILKVTLKRKYQIKHTSVCDKLPITSQTTFFLKE